MKKSPLQRAGGGGLADWLRYADIAKAGKPQSLTGEAIVQLGALFTQVFPDDLIDLGKKKKSDKYEVTENFDVKKLYDDADFDNEIVDVNDVEVLEEPLDDIEISQNGVIKNPKNTGVTKEPTTIQSNDLLKGFDVKENTNISVRDTTGRGTSSTASMAFDPNTTKFQQQFNNKTTNVNNFDIASIMEDIEASKYKNIYDVSTPNKRLDNNTLEILKKLSYTRKNDDDSPLFRVAHVASSPFTKTDMVGYRYMKRAVMPEYAQGSLGSAAAEGFNLAIDKYNYNQAVKEDFDNLLEEETKGLDIDVDFTGADFQKDYLNTAQGIKQEVAQAVAQYAQGKITKMDLEAIKTKSLARVKSLAGAGQQLKTLRTDYVDKIEKGLIDPGASNGQHTDLFNTLYKAPDNLTVKTINGIDYVVGKTIQGNDLKVAVSKLADGTTGLGVMPKADLSSLVTLAGTKIGAATKEGKTALGMGTIGASLEDAERISKEVFEAKLRSDETFLRSAVSQIAGLDYDEYEAATAGPEKQAEKAALIEDTAQAMFQQYIKPGYTQTSQTKYRDTPKRGSTTAGERKIAKIKADLDKLPPLSSTTLSSYASQLDKKIYQLKEDPKTGSFYINDFKNKRRINLPSDPIEAKTEIAGYAGVTGYSQAGQSQDVSQYNFDL
jgi:hypothetical protein